MSFNADEYTDKMLEGVKSAMQLAVENQNLTVDLAHVLLAFWEQDDGYLKNIIDKVGAQPVEFERAIRSTIARLPAQDPAPPEPGFSRSFFEALPQAKKEMQAMGDSLVAVDTFLLALTYQKSVHEILD
ncbi:hypothetical protein FBU59_006750, partial [Linderina macrospora]